MATETLTTMTLEQPVDGVLVATLNRPDRLNAMTNQMFDELEAARRSAHRLSDLRALIITGAGRAFCAGFDLADADGLSDARADGDAHAAGARGPRAARRCASLPMPVIAAVNGPATGGGLALALAADIRIGSPAARFNAAFVRIGLSAGDLGTSWLLPRLIGPARAAEFCLHRALHRGRGGRAASACSTASCPPTTLLDAALELAGQIAANSPGGVQLSKRALQANLEAASYAAALELENRGQALLTRGAGHARGARRLQGEARAALHGRMNEILEQPTIARAFLRSVAAQRRPRGGARVRHRPLADLRRVAGALRRRRRRPGEAGRRARRPRRAADDEPARVPRRRHGRGAARRRAVLALQHRAGRAAAGQRRQRRAGGADRRGAVRRPRPRARRAAAADQAASCSRTTWTALEAAAPASTSWRAPRPSSPATC